MEREFHARCDKKKKKKGEIGKSTKSIAKRFVPSSKASLAVEAILYKFPTIALLLRAPTLPSFISTLLIVRPEKRSAPESKNYGAVQRSTSPPKIRRPETLRHTPQTGPLRLHVRRLRRHRPRHRRRYQIHCPQCRRALRRYRLRFVHQPRLL